LQGEVANAEIKRIAEKIVVNEQISTTAQNISLSLNVKIRVCQSRANIVDQIAAYVGINPTRHYE